VAEAKKIITPKSKSELRRLAIQAPERLPYRDDDPVEGEDIEMFPAEAEVAADAAVEAEIEAEKKTRSREPLYHAIVMQGDHPVIVQASTKFRFAQSLANYHPDQVLVMVKGKEIPKIVKPTLAL